MKKIRDIVSYRKVQQRRLRRFLNTEYRTGHTSRPHNGDQAKRQGIPRNRDSGAINFIKVYSPENLRLFSARNSTVEFIRKIRSTVDSLKNAPNHAVFVDLTALKEINYGTISILKALIHNFTSQNIVYGSNLPADERARQYLEECGYLDGLLSMAGKPFPPHPTSSHIFFQGGQGRLTEAANLRISELVEGAVEFLGGDRSHELKLKPLILEVCANSIEWARTRNSEWMLGMKQEQPDGNRDRSILITVTDTGKGILETLKRKSADGNFVMDDLSDHEILKLAFERKWGSRSREPNRNNGLPAMLRAFQDGFIDDLVIVTNNVMLRYGNDPIAKTFPKGSPRYNGTFFQWRVSKRALTKNDSDF